MTAWVEPDPLPSDRPVRVAVVGSTGSIGVQALEVVAAHPDRFEVVGLSAGSSAAALIAQAEATGAPVVGVADAAAAAEVRDALAANVEVIDGDGASACVAEVDADVVVNGITGSRGLAPTLRALASGARVALANKESLVVGGPVVTRAARPGQIVPVDSEHSALAQCLRGGRGGEVARLVVTASGGPFRGRTRADLATVTAADALAHPTWAMGPVITVNSASLANKGLEVIEAHLLFGIAYDDIDVVVHPQSFVHGMVEFCDGAVIAKLSPPDMRLPIQLALGWPERFDDAPARMDWTEAATLTFEPVDADTFPMLGLCIEAGRTGGTAPAVLNAANEEAVEAFLVGRVGFLGIADAVAATLEAHTVIREPDLDAVLDAESWARRTARDHLTAVTA